MAVLVGVGLRREHVKLAVLIILVLLAMLIWPSVEQHLLRVLRRVRRMRR